MTFTPTLDTHHLVTSRAGTVFGWLVEPGTYRVQRANDFAPKIASGKPTHSDLDLWPTIDLEDWSHGLGQEFLRDDPARFLDADGELETAIPGQVTLAAQWTASDASFVAYAFRDYGNYMYAGGASSVRKYDPVANTWADSKTGLAAAVVAMHTCYNKLYVGLGNSNTMWNYDGSTWTVMTGHNANCFETWKALLWFGSAGNIVSYDGAAAYTTVAVGDPQTNVTALVSQNGYLVIFKDDGRVYLTSDGAAIADLMTNSAYSGNYKGALSADGWLYYSLLSSIQRLSAIGVAPSMQTITPKNVDDDQYEWGIPVGFTASPNYVYALFKLAENSYPVLLKWNGSGWHMAYQGAAAATAYACYYSPVSGRVWVNDGSSRYQRVTTVNDTPYPSYATDTTRTLYTCHLTAGFDDVPKMFRDVRVISEYLTQNVKLYLYYQIDRSGTWVYFGTVTQSPNQIVPFASGSAISATDLWLRVDFATNSAATTPKLKGLHLTYQTRPTPVYTISATLRVGNYLELLDMGRTTGVGRDPHTQDELLAELMEMAESDVPITLNGMDGLTYQVIQANVMWREALRRDDATAFSVPVTFLQAFASASEATVLPIRAGVSRWGLEVYS